MIRPWFRQAAVPWKTTATQTRASGENRVSTKPGVLHTADPTAFPEAAAAVRGTFGLERMIMVGDRGIITTARITDLRKMDGMAWITCLRYPAIKKLMAGDGPLQLSLFDEQDLAEITSPDFPSSG